MDQRGNIGDADLIMAMDDLSISTLIALIDRLKQTETPDQFLCREIELDGAVLQADFEMRIAVDKSAQPPALHQLQQIRVLVCNAHDLVGENNVRGAVEELNKIVEMKIGL